MCLGAALALVLIPLFAGAFGFARWGTTGAWVGALAGLAAALALTAGPFALLAAGARKRMAREAAMLGEDESRGG